MNADGSGQRKLTGGKLAVDGSPAWSPNGRKIAFVRDGVYVVNADGSEERRLTRIGDTPTWSPNGQKLAFRSALTSGPNGNSEIYVVNANGRGQRRLTRKPGKIATGLVARRAEDRFREQLAGLGHERRRKRETKADAERGAQLQSCVVPDGRRIAFERPPRRGGSYKPGSAGFEVYVMNADGSGEQRLTRGGSQPRWSPDGRKIAYLSKRGGNRDIRIMNAMGAGSGT